LQDGASVTIDGPLWLLAAAGALELSGGAALRAEEIVLAHDREVVITDARLAAAGLFGSLARVRIERSAVELSAGLVTGILELDGGTLTTGGPVVAGTILADPSSGIVTE
jgi:hypothetical protein